MIRRDADTWPVAAERTEARHYDERGAHAEDRGGEVVPIGRALAQGGYQIATVRARTFHDAHTIGEYFRQDVPVIIDLHELDDAGAKRIVDFASGLIFGREGDIERLASRMFLILPPRFTVLRDRVPSTDEGFFNQT